MSHQTTDDANKTEQQPEMSELMAAFNPEPPRAERPLRFYWHEQWEGHDSGAVQAAFES